MALMLKEVELLKILLLGKIGLDNTVAIVWTAMELWIQVYQVCAVKKMITKENLENADSAAHAAVNL